MSDATELIRAVAALAWPVAVVVIVWFFRPEIKRLMNERLEKVKAGPFSAEWSRTVAEVQLEVAQVEVELPQLESARDMGPLTESLLSRARVTRAASSWKRTPGSRTGCASRSGTTAQPCQS